METTGARCRREDVRRVADEVMTSRFARLNFATPAPVPRQIGTRMADAMRRSELGVP